MFYQINDTRPEHVAITNVRQASPFNDRTVTTATRRRNSGYHINRFSNYGLGVDEVDCDSVAETECVLMRGKPTVNEACSTSSVNHNEDKELHSNACDVVDSASFDEEPLYCPNCGHSFTLDHHIDLMNHMDVCV